jgi:hypothetical protein
MAFTTPGTAVAGEVLTAAFWNEQVRDNLNVLRAFTNVNSTTLTNAFTQAMTTTYVDITNYSVTITPTFATSKVLIMANAHVLSDAGVQILHYRLVRGTTAISVGAAAGNRVQASIGIWDNGSPQTAMIHYLDSPATTSAITYKIQCRSATGSATLYFNRSKLDTDSSSFQRLASTITAIEIPA